MTTVLVNAAAGTNHGMDVAKMLAARLLAGGVDADVIEMPRGQDPAEAARAASRHAAVVAAAGGDGTVSRIASGLTGTKTVLAVLPMGTLNHFAKDLGIPLDLDSAIAVIATGRVSRVDVGRVNDRVFVNNCSIGIYPNIVDAREELRREGHGKWPAFALATWRVLRHYRGVLVRVGVNGPQSRQSAWRTPFVFLGNNAYELEGLHLGGRTALDAGRLFAFLAPRLHSRDLPMLLVRALLGRVKQTGQCEVVSAEELWVDTPQIRRIKVAIDGETTIMDTPLHCRIDAGALQVLRPEGAR